MTPDLKFLISFAIGGVLTLAILAVSDWITQRRFDREMRAKKGQPTR